jgi:hypothetical protein
LEKKKPRPCPWRGGDFFAVTTWPGPKSQKALPHMHKSGMPMAKPALNMERPWNGKDRAAAMRCLSNKVSLLQCAPCRLDVDYVGVSARLQEVSAWYKAGSITQFEGGLCLLGISISLYVLPNTSRQIFHIHAQRNWKSKDQA